MAGDGDYVTDSFTLANIKAYERDRVRKALTEAAQYKALADYEELLLQLTPHSRSVAQALDTTTPATLLDALDDIHL